MHHAPVSTPVTILGAGLVGSLLASMLAQHGYPVTVYERRPDPRVHGFVGGRSINLALSDRGWRALERIGLAEVVRQQALPMRGRMIHNLPTGQVFQPYGQEGQAIYSVSRAGLNQALVEHAERQHGVKFQFGQRCVGVQLDEGSILLDHQGPDAIVQLPTSVLLATDGAFSEVRDAMLRTPRFNYSQTYLDYGYKELHIPPGPDGRHQLAPDALHIWPRGAFMLIALPNPDGSFTATLFLAYEGADSFAGLQTDAEIQAFFGRYFPDTLPLLGDLLGDFRQNPTSHLVTVRCTPWHHSNRILLLGDAAHAIVPFYGQGMNAGFEDCTVLEEMLVAHQHNWDTLIPAYSRRRAPDGHAIADLALRNFLEMRDWVADPRFLLRKEIAASLHERYPEFIPLYSMVTFSHIPYSTAWAQAQAQDELFEQILQLDGIANTWRHDPRVDTVFKAWWAANKPA